MPKREVKKQSAPHWILRYSVSLATVMGAVALRLILEKFAENQSTPFLLLFAAVLFSSAFGGLGPGLVATLLGALASDYFFIGSERYSLSMTLPESMQVLLFMLEGMFISVLGARLQAARRRAENSEAQARILEQKILDISDAERRRIGQDLHDGLGQHLTGVAFLSKALQQRLASRALPEAADANKIVMLVSESIGQTRALAKGLSPIGLEEGGLSVALSQLAASTSSVFGIECSCQFNDGIEVMDFASGTHLYRIAQEAINNAIRHGKATQIEIALESYDHQLRLTVQDNGSGIMPRIDHGGMGLQIMGFRARMIGGSLQVERQNIGTAVTCSVPLPMHHN
ncbi:MAG TPA: sensor histidine kinase [Tepidisphaeraceae bacterium]|nr:sensor histidine kinase [Tepidisphaeraceae bacterium]